jgi:RNA polymerase sigma-70 factor (TIGR02943 family)
MTDFAVQVEHLRPALMRFARLQLRNEAWAEDAVSEVVLAALEKPQSFGGQSQLKTWLIGILKHKLVDQIRRHAREVSLGGEDEDGGLEDLVFQADGHFREAPPDWGSPEHACRQQQFVQVLEACVSQLPARTGRAFMLREWLEFETDEICKELGVTPTHLWVMLHRARLRLRECLQTRWQGPA